MLDAYRRLLGKRKRKIVSFKDTNGDGKAESLQFIVRTVLGSNKVCCLGRWPACNVHAPDITYYKDKLMEMAVSDVKADSFYRFFNKKKSANNQSSGLVLIMLDLCE